MSDEAASQAPEIAGSTVPEIGRGLGALEAGAPLAVVMLCHFHHHLVHEAGYGVEPTARGDLVFTRPDGKPLPEYRTVEKCFRRNISDRNRSNGIRIDPGAVDTRWTGEHMDYSMAIDSLLAARERERQAAGGAM